MSNLPSESDPVGSHQAAPPRFPPPVVKRKAAGKSEQKQFTPMGVHDISTKSEFMIRKLQHIATCAHPLFE
jgi:hypothetical protein